MKTDISQNSFAFLGARAKLTRDFVRVDLALRRHPPAPLGVFAVLLHISDHFLNRNTLISLFLEVDTPILDRTKMKRKAVNCKDVLLHRFAVSSQRLVLASFGQCLSCGSSDGAKRA